MSTPIKTKSLDEQLDALIRKHGMKEVLAALCRRANEMGMPGIFTRLNRVYEWLTAPPT